MAYYLVRYFKEDDEYRVCPTNVSPWTREMLRSVFINTEQALTTILEAEDHREALCDGTVLIEEYGEQSSFWYDELGRVTL